MDHADGGECEPRLTGLQQARAARRRVDETRKSSVWWRDKSCSASASSRNAAPTLPNRTPRCPHHYRQSTATLTPRRLLRSPRKCRGRVRDAMPASGTPFSMALFAAAKTMSGDLGPFAHALDSAQRRRSVTRRPLCRTYHISVDPHRWIVSATLCMCIDLQRAVAKSARSQVPGPSPAPPMLRRATEVTFECEALLTPLLILPFPLRQRRSFVTFLAQNAVSHKRCGIGLRMGGYYESTPLFCPPVLVRMLALEAHGIYAGPSIHFCFGTKKLTLCGHP